MSSVCKRLGYTPNNIKFFTKLEIEPDFSCLADEKAEPRPGMNIKVAAFTVSEKSSNIWNY